jgi:hypothetical protein
MKKMDVFDVYELMEIKIDNCEKQIKYWKDKLYCANLMNRKNDFYKKKIYKWKLKLRRYVKELDDCEECIEEMRRN